MNKVINGKRFNTDTAIFYGSAPIKINRVPCTLSLYRKRGGEYFIATADGEPEYVKRLSPRQAKVWAYRHLPIDDYERHFGGAVMNSTDKQSQLLSLKKCTIEKLRIAAAKDNTSMSEIVDRLATLLVVPEEVCDDEI